MAVCPSCGHENPDGAKFCMECAAVLAAPVAVREQRKTVTVLFCDVTGSTALGEQLDPESLRGVMARYFDAARLVVERHGGFATRRADRGVRRREKVRSDRDLRTGTSARTAM